MTVDRVAKPWGHELIWARTERYVGKVLHIRAGEALSLQYHQVKDETIKATLKFTQTKASEDLDLYLYDPAGVQLTKCTEADPWECDSSNGQSSTSNENLSYKIPATGDYFVVVHGWEGAQNKYDICIDYTSTSKTTSGCPAL